MPHDPNQPNGQGKVATDSDLSTQVKRLASVEEWEQLARTWPLRQLVALWNELPGVVPVKKVYESPGCLDKDLGALHPDTAPLPRARKKEKPAFHEGSKAAQMMALLCRPEGAAVRELQQSTGWQAHSVRGFLSASVRKQGRTVRSSTRAVQRVYRVLS